MTTLTVAKIDEIRAKIAAGQPLIALTGALYLESVEYNAGQLYAEINNAEREGCNYEVSWREGDWKYWLTGGMCEQGNDLFEEDMTWQDVLIEAVKYAVEHPRGGK